MPAPLCPSKREVVEDALSRSVDISAISHVVGVSIRQVAKMKRNIEKYGSSRKPREKTMGRPKKLKEGMEEELKAYLHEHPTVYIGDVRSFLAERFDVKLSVATVSRLLKRLGHILPLRVERPPRPTGKKYRPRKPKGEPAIEQQVPEPETMRPRPEYALDPQLADKGQTGPAQSEERTTLDHVMRRDEQHMEGVREPLEDFIRANGVSGSARGFAQLDQGRMSNGIGV